MCRSLFTALVALCLSWIVPTAYSRSENLVPNTSPIHVRVKAEIWADNWFAFYLGDKLIKEDSVPITVERSFNSDVFVFEAEYPLSLNIVAKDFIENDTGLEYIGTRRQQMGDGGLIVQFTNADTGELLAVTNSDWKCFVTHTAPLDDACEREPNPVAGTKPCGFTKRDEPKGWRSPLFDDSAWAHATVYSSKDVGPKGGYDDIVWDKRAQFIWGPDLKKDNTVLCRLSGVRPKLPR